MKKSLHILGKVLSWLLIALIVAAILFPFAVMFFFSLKTMSEIRSPDPSLLPDVAVWENYKTALQTGSWGQYFFNSTFVTVIVVVISLIINSMSGYVFARLNFRFKNFLFVLILAGMMIPPQVTMIPVVSLIRSVPLAGGNDILGQGGSGLINTYSGLIIPFIAGSFGVFLCRQYFVSFPRELDDAALIDGCGRFRTFVSIYLPLGKPVLASLAVLKFAGTWNEYTWPLVITQGDAMKTVQIALTNFRNESEIRWNLLMAATLMVSAVVCLVFIFAQKHFVNGILTGSIKG